MEDRWAGTGSGGNACVPSVAGLPSSGACLFLASFCLVSASASSVGAVAGGKAGGGAAASSSVCGRFGAGAGVDSMSDIRRGLAIEV